MKKPTDIIKTLPANPGVYLYKDARGRILYIGKAKNLRNRVRSYFAPGADLTRSKQVMVSAIADIETILTTTEAEALVLESTLIKRHRPEYNIDLKDDKYFLYIKITDDAFPTLETVRRIGTDRSKYFGPYASTRAVRVTLQTLKNIFHYRTCKPGQGRPCFDYTIGRCAGPCVNAISERQYQTIIKHITSFLRGNVQSVVQELTTDMKKASRARQYERAARYRDQLAALAKLRIAQRVVAPKRTSQDIIGLYRRSGLAAINLFKVRNGALIEKQTMLIDRAHELSDETVIDELLERYYPQTTDWPKEIIVPVLPTEASAVKTLTGARITVPQKGEKKKLLVMSMTNAADWLTRSEQAEAGRERQAIEALGQLSTALAIPTPRRIEVYDISNTQGVLAVGSMIVFTQGQPDKSQYRKFNIRSVKGSNDPAMLAEVLQRRFNSEQLKDAPLPDLIILDGGRGQLSIVDQHLPDWVKKIPLVALAKRLEELYLRNRRVPLQLRPNTPGFFLLQRMRDEAHRFAIGSHRSLRQRTAIKSQLDEIPGIGPVTRKRLLAAFGSVEGIRNASPSELTKIVGTNVAQNIYDHLS